MGSKRPKKSKQDLQNVPNKKSEHLEEAQLDNAIAAANTEDVATKPIKRKKKDEHEVPLPKKVKKTHAPVEVINGESEVKKSKSKDKKKKVSASVNGLSNEPEPNSENVKQKKKKKKKLSDIVNGLSLKLEPDGDANVKSEYEDDEANDDGDSSHSQNKLDDTTFGLQQLKVKTPKRVEITWPDDDLNELFNQIEKHIPELDLLQYKSRAEKLDWNSIAFKNYSAEECRNIWFQVQKKMRKYRLLREVVNDAKLWISNPKELHMKRNKQRHHPDMPRRPLTSYLLFYLKKRDQISRDNPNLEKSELTKLAGQLFKTLTPEKRAKYEKRAAILKEEYLEKLRIFYENHPEFVPVPKVPKSAKLEKLAKKAEKLEKAKKVDKPPEKCKSPFNLFYASELKKKDPSIDIAAFKEKCKAEYKVMPDKKKVVWINLAEQDLIRYQEEAARYKETHPDYEMANVKSILTKDEKAIKERASGKPVKPANSAYGLFSTIMLKSDEIKSVHPKDRMNLIANKWRDCSEEEKNFYKDKMMDMNEQYKLEYAAYVESLPEDEKKKILETQKMKIKKEVRKAVKRKSKSKSPGKSKSAIVDIKAKVPEQPPLSPCKYFVSVYKGDGDPVQVWKTLSSEEKKRYKDELTQRKHEYIVQFEQFLNSLNKQELEAFSKARELKKSDENQEDEEESSDCSSSSEDEQEDGDDADEDEDHDSESE